jgi:hypothetical protein
MTRALTLISMHVQVSYSNDRIVPLMMIMMTFKSHTMTT